jgi:hypothetical protein
MCFSLLKVAAAHPSDPKIRAQNVPGFLPPMTLLSSLTDSSDRMQTTYFPSARL